MNRCPASWRILLFVSAMIPTGSRNLTSRPRHGSECIGATSREKSRLFGDFWPLGCLGVRSSTSGSAAQKRPPNIERRLRKRWSERGARVTFPNNGSFDKTERHIEGFNQQETKLGRGCSGSSFRMKRRRGGSRSISGHNQFDGCEHPGLDLDHHFGELRRACVLHRVEGLRLGPYPISSRGNLHLE